MQLLDKKKLLCTSCMGVHDVQIVRITDRNIFKGVAVEYPCNCYYCERTGEFFEDESMITQNDISMKDAYRAAKGLLTSTEILAVRKKYGISKNDLRLLLGWEEKTLTRYEEHQVQTISHDKILRKLDTDPEWFLSLLKNSKESFSRESYEKYYSAASMNLQLPRISR